MSETDKKSLDALVEKKRGKLIAVASTGEKDRMGDMVDVKGWVLGNFRKNPVIQFAHNYTVPPIGTAENIKIVGNKLIFEPVFHTITQLAREIKQMYEAEPPIMRAFSVGFIPLKMDDVDSHKILKQELLEISSVPVPALASALTISKSFSDEEVKKVGDWVSERKNKEVGEEESEEEVVEEEAQDETEKGEEKVEEPKKSDEGEGCEECAGDNDGEVEDKPEGEGSSNEEGVVVDAQEEKGCGCRKVEEKKPEEVPDERKTDEEPEKEESESVPESKGMKEGEVEEESSSEEASSKEEVEKDDGKGLAEMITEEFEKVNGEKRKFLIESGDKELVEKTISALQSLLKVCEPAVSGEGKLKGRREVARKPLTSRVKVRALQKIAKDFDNILRDIKEDAKND